MERTSVLDRKSVSERKSVVDFKVLLEGELDKKADNAGLIGSSWQCKQVSIYKDGQVEYQKKGETERHKLIKVVDVTVNGALIDVKAIIDEVEVLRCRTFHFRAKNEQQAGRWQAGFKQAMEARAEMRVTLSEAQDVVLIGPLQSVDGYVPRNDRSHLRLGLNFEAMWMYMADIDFIQYTGGESTNMYGTCRGWKYMESYERQEELKWLDDVVGPLQEDEDEGLTNVTGYDVSNFIKLWLELKESKRLSVTEVILTSDLFPLLRPSISQATLYWSHMHREPLLRNGTFASLDLVRKTRADELPPEDQQFFFLDYFSVRQAMDGEMNVSAVAALVKDIGQLVASIDSSLEYTGRSWCVFEVWAALNGKASLVCHAPISRSTVEELMETRPIQSEKASTRKPQDKANIESLMRTAGSVEILDKIVTGAIVTGVLDEVPVVVEKSESTSGSPSGKKSGKKKVAKEKDGTKSEASTKTKEKKKTNQSKNSKKP